MKTYLYLFLGVVMISACSADSSISTNSTSTLNATDMMEDMDDTTDTSSQEISNQITIDTYNVGLAHGYVPYAAERLSSLANALATHTGDVMCLQEVWKDVDRDHIMTVTQNQYPYSFFQVTERTETNPGCSMEEVEPLRICIDMRCPDVSPGELATCGLEECGTEFESTSAECQTCIATHLGQSLEEIVSACEGGGPSFSYGGHNGLLLLSKYPLQNMQLMPLSSTLVQRAVLSAQVQIENHHPLQIHCTHLASDLSGSIQYSGTMFDSFEAEQSAQITELLAWSNEHSHQVPALILGDLNTGPENNQNRAELPDNFDMFQMEGYESAYVTADSLCTYCQEDIIIDHVLLKRLDRSQVTARRTFDQTEPIMIDMMSQSLHLSDHFGVQVTLPLSFLAP